MEDSRSDDSDAKGGLYECIGNCSWGSATDEKLAQEFGNLPDDSTALLPWQVIFLDMRAIEMIMVKFCVSML